MEELKISQFAETIITAYEKNEILGHDKKMTVNPVVSTVASWYEKLRNAMDYREEEVILRAAIERILKRRLMLGGNGKSTGEPLVKELLWARYFQDETIAESSIGVVEKRIDLYLELKSALSKKKMLSESVITEYISQLLSSDLAKMLHPNRKKELIANFMFYILKEQIIVEDEEEQTRDVQVFLGVRKAFAKDDLAFLRYHLFMQLYGGLTRESFAQVAQTFEKGYAEIEKQLHHPRKEKIYGYIKSRTAVFFILEDILLSQKAALRDLWKNQEEFKKVVFTACDGRYAGIRAKVQRAIIRSVVFILFTKVFFAFAIEGTFERLFYGAVSWRAILINTSIPPLLMIIVGVMLKSPGADNSERIFTYLKKVLSEDHPRLGAQLVIRKQADRMEPVMQAVFSFLWVMAFFLTFGILIFILTTIEFTFISQVIFLFFVTIVSFLCYRISIIPRAYRVEEKTSFSTPLVDFFFMPIIRVGRRLTEGISSVNIFLFLFDFIIETPFKGLFGFFEQWFLFLHAKREDLG